LTSSSLLSLSICCSSNHTSTTTLYTLSLHDALPISERGPRGAAAGRGRRRRPGDHGGRGARAVGGGRDGDARAAGLRHAGRDSRDRKSTRLNSSHVKISYAVFCLKKKSRREEPQTIT